MGKEKKSIINSLAELPLWFTEHIQPDIIILFWGGWGFCFHFYSQYQY